MIKKQQNHEEGSILIWITIWSSITILIGITLVTLGIGHYQQKTTHQQAKIALYIGEGAFAYAYSQLSDVLVHAINKGYEEAYKEAIIILEEEKERRNKGIASQTQILDDNESWNMNILDSSIQRSFHWGCSSYLSQWIQDQVKRDDTLFLSKNEFWDSYVDDFIIQSKTKNVQFSSNEVKKTCSFTIESSIYVSETKRKLEAYYLIESPNREIPYTVEWHLISTEEGERYDFHFNLIQDSEIFTPYSQWITMKVGIKNEQ